MLLNVFFFSNPIICKCTGPRRCCRAALLEADYYRERRLPVFDYVIKSPFFSIAFLNDYIFVVILRLHEPAFAIMPIPDLPGELVPRNSDQDRWLKSLVAGLCQLDHER